MKAFIVLLIAVFIFFPRSGLSEEKGTWLHAGPLSDIRENIQKKADLNKIREAPPAEETIIADERNMEKPERFSFGNWVRKIFSKRK